MALSEYEQQVLRQMEQQLRAEDPKLASDFGARPRIDARRILIAIAFVVAGLSVLLGGVTLSWIWLGVVGFVLMLSGVMVFLGGGSSEAQVNGSAPQRPAPHAPRSPQQGQDGGSFMKRQAEKWERRQEGGPR